MPGGLLSRSRQTQMRLQLGFDFKRFRASGSRVWRVLGSFRVGALKGLQHLGLGRLRSFGSAVVFTSSNSAWKVVAQKSKTSLQNPNPTKS